MTAATATADGSKPPGWLAGWLDQTAIEAALTAVDRGCSPYGRLVVAGRPASGVREYE